MLLQFSVENFRSIKGRAVLSMEASLDKEHTENVFQTSTGLRLLRTASLYGANASGKSNLFAGMHFMRNFVFESSNAQITSKILVEPFRLSTQTEHGPTFFEIVFSDSEVKYRYGFQLNTDKIFAEWLFSYPKGKETRLFTRENNTFSINKKKFLEGKKDLIDKTRQNALFLSTVAQFNGEISKKVLSIFSTINVLSGLEEDSYTNFAINKLKEESVKPDILRFIRNADLDIEDFTTEVVNLSPEKIPNIFKDEVRAQMATGVKISTVHKKYDKNNKVDSLALFDLVMHESAGTRKLFFLSIPILDTLLNGKTLFIDEMDSRLHPIIMQSLITLFNSKKSNPKNAQLIFNAHNTLLLGKKYFRRDQIWFIQKDRYGASEVYSLDDYSVRKDSSFDKDYLLGKYGGIPILDHTYEEQKERS